MPFYRIHNSITFLDNTTTSHPHSSNYRHTYFTSLCSCTLPSENLMLETWTTWSPQYKGQNLIPLINKYSGVLHKYGTGQHILHELVHKIKELNNQIGKTVTDRLSEGVRITGLDPFLYGKTWLPSPDFFFFKFIQYFDLWSFRLYRNCLLHWTRNTVRIPHSRKYSGTTPSPSFHLQSWPWRWWYLQHIHKFGHHTGENQTNSGRINLQQSNPQSCPVKNVFTELFFSKERGSNKIWIFYGLFRWNAGIQLSSLVNFVFI